MRLDVRLHDTNAQEILREYLQRRLDFAMNRFGNRIGTVTFSIHPSSSERRDEFTRRVHVELHPFGTVRAEAVHSDVYAAVDHALRRVARQCATKVDRPRMMRSSRMSIRVA